ncbi:hypothetical protein H8E88_11585 [candidate division KSB1 bacterium]|nr:hypothetical protein [candidate division KSB1 bacterium]
MKCRWDQAQRETGFPLALEDESIEWMTLSKDDCNGPNLINLQREHLNQATFAYNKLVKRFPKALQYIVEERDEWVERIPQLLDWIKDGIHHGKTLPSFLLNIEGSFSNRILDRANSLLKQHPQLHSLLCTFSWINYLTPKKLNKTLAWIERNVQAVLLILKYFPQPGSIKHILNLWVITLHDGERSIHPLLNYLCDSRTYTVSIEGDVVEIQNLIFSLRCIAKEELCRNIIKDDSLKLSGELLTFTSWLTCQGKDKRRSSLKLFNTLYPNNILDRWHKWWDGNEALIIQGRRLVSVQYTKLSKEQKKKINSSGFKVRKITAK